MSECRDCAYSDRPTYKWPCSVCRDTKNGRSMYCPEEADHIANDEGETDYVSRQWLLNEYDKRHKGPPGGARKMIEEAPPADVRPVVLCRDCIHRPYETVPGVRYGLTVKSPDSVYKCPCYCDGDGWYSYIPDDDFFCANGERLREGGTP